MDQNINDNKKEKVLSIRIKESLLADIDKISEKEGLSRSDYIRKSISDQISYSEFFNRLQTFLIDPLTFKYSLDFMDDIEIEECASISVKNGLEILKSYLNLNIHTSIVQKYITNKKAIISGLLQYITHSILGPNGQKWFKRIRYSWESNIITIAGIHNLGLKFSRFIYYYLIQFFTIFDFKEKLDDQIVKEDKIKISFDGKIDVFDIKKLM